MDILFFIAIAIIFGFVAGRLTNRIRLPGVVGYLIAGLILGPSFLHVFSAPLLDKLEVFSSFALSLIAFIIGSEMKLTTLRQMGKGIGIITILESFGAFILVATGVYLLTKKLFWALVFGAMAPASAPAGTVAVLQEYRTKGRLTNALYAVVGLDDGLAIMIFAIAVALGKILLTGEALSLQVLLKGPAVEIIGSIILGVLTGFSAGYCTRKIHADDNILVMSLAAILICAAIANYLHFSLILANLCMGMVFVNVFPSANQKAYRALQSISLPVYIIFFFVAGASLQVGLLPSMGFLGLVYIVCRICGLMGGAFIGATVSRQSPVIRKYLGLGILSQAGVAIGLSILAAGEFEILGEQGESLAIAVVNTIAATTIFFEIIGPITTRFAVSKAGEIGINITEEDLIETYAAGDVTDTKVPLISAGMSLSEVINIVSSTDNFYYPVVNERKVLIGVITLDGIRRTFATQQLNDWLVALDITEPLVMKVNQDDRLSDCLEKMRRFGIEYAPVVSSERDDKLIGVLDTVGVHRRLSAEILAKQQKADLL
ncbi:MAG: cation:proton antiporter [Sedimentisphaerales bacterium]